MRVETTNDYIYIVERNDVKGEWYVRWDFSQKPNEPNVFWYEEETFHYRPTLDDIKKVITNWLNKQTDGAIKHGFEWKGIRVYLSDENKFNYKAITDEAARRETAIAIWDKENPKYSGKYVIEVEATDSEGNTIIIPHPTGRPMSMLPVTLKLGEKNLPENFYQFNTIVELQDFYSAGVDHLIYAYCTGWQKIATFDWQVYIDALEKL